MKVNGVEKLCKLVEALGIEGTIDFMGEVITLQGVKTAEQFEDAIDEELVLLEV